MKQLVIHIKDLMRMEDISYSTAWRKMKNIRKNLGSKGSFITVRQYATFYGFSVEEVEELLDKR